MEPARSHSNDTVGGPDDAPADRSAEKPTQPTDLSAQDGSARPIMQKFSHGVFDPAIAPLRKVYFKIVVMMSILIVLSIWGFLSFYWGSLWAQPEYAYRLTTLVVDRDGGSSVSTAVLNAVAASNAGPAPHLGYRVVSADLYPTDAELEERLLKDHAWAAVVIHPGAEAALLTARQNGDASYNGSSAVSAYYVQARNELAAGNYIVPQLTSVLGRALATASAQSVASYLSAQGGNATAMALLARAPTTLSSPYTFAFRNLRVYDVPVFTAVSLVGLIYLLVLSFIATMGNAAAREVLGPWLTLRSYIVLRLVWPICNYFFISLFFAMLNLPFKVPFGQGPYSHASGFVIWWMLCWFGMCALGLATEAMVTILTTKFIAFFLVLWIVVNVSETSVPIELSGSAIYRLGYAMPFWNINQAVRCIVFNTDNVIGRSFGVLIAWIAISCITIPLFTAFKRRGEVKEHEEKVAAGKAGPPADKA